MRTILIGCFCLLNTPVLAQSTTIQQPVIGMFGVNTMVSVPDRGEGLLGRINQRSTGRNSFGPFWSGNSWGESSSAGSASVRVWIHDTPNMDDAILKSFERQLGQKSAAEQANLARSILQSRSRQMSPDYSLSRREFPTR